ncbi:MAG TPA: L,D-transpeptidase family protein [Gaiellaceae bacterium]|nr:L,D-transpeptidase family protein [Gaiellaceae bacterium]
MKRLHAAALFVLGFVAAGAFSGAVIADVTTSTSTSTDATTTVATTTAATTTTTTTASGDILPLGVRVAGVRVGGLSPADATSAVRDAFGTSLPVIVDRSTFQLDPSRYASLYAATAVAKARISPSGTNVPLVVSVRGSAVRAWAAAVAKRFDRKAVDAKLTFKNGRPKISKDSTGRTVSARTLAARVISALQSNSRLPVRVQTKTVAPKVTAASFGAVIVVNRSVNRLYLYKGAKPWRIFHVATGQAIYPTPKGLWHIVVKQRNPWWYPPTYDSWAKGLKPVPPGPDNPLGTRWMGLNAPGVGIHGTDEPASIGYSESHGCIRMQVPDAEWLFDHVDVGTNVLVI